KMMNVGDPAHQRIFHRNDAKIAVAGPHRLDRVLEAGMGNGGGVRDGLARGEIGISTRLALKSDTLGVIDRSGHERMFRARSKSAGVSTLSGTLSTRATAMLIFASRARSCSSFSRTSRGEGGRATNRARASRR